MITFEKSLHSLYHVFVSKNEYEPVDIAFRKITDWSRPEDWTCVLRLGRLPDNCWLASVSLGFNNVVDKRVPEEGAILEFGPEVGAGLFAHLSNVWSCACSIPTPDL